MTKHASKVGTGGGRPRGCAYCLVGLAGCVEQVTPSAGLTPAPATGHAYSHTDQQSHGDGRAAKRNAGSVAQAYTDRAGGGRNRRAHANRQRGSPTTRVIEVVDGDTIKVLVAGDKFTLRYIGIDTPEMSAADGKAAHEQNVALVGGRPVRLEQDVSATDPYGRLLRYVWVGDLMVNAELVRLGYPRAVAYPPDTKNQARFTGLQAEAGRDGARAVGACGADAGRRAQAGADHGDAAGWGDQSERAG